MKKTVIIVIAFAAASLAAETITWTGAAGTSNWTDAENWDLNREPRETDDVVIDGAAVSAAGDRRIPRSLTLLNDASYVIGGQMQFGNAGVENPMISGGYVSGTLVACQYSGSTLTVHDASIVDTGTDNNGFWQLTGSCLNIVDGDARAATFTYQKIIASDPYYFFSNPTASAPYIRYNGATISREEFDDNFEYTDNGDSVTLSLKHLSGWRISSLSAGQVSGDSVSVAFSATRYDGGTADVYIGCADSDLGSDFIDWNGKLAKVGEGIPSTTAFADQTVSLSPGKNFVRVFVVFDGTFSSALLAVRNAVFGDYGALTRVYEYIGGVGGPDQPSSWALNKTPVSAGSVPDPGTDIRWLGYAADYEYGYFNVYPTDHFVGANMSIAEDFALVSDATFTNSAVSVGMIVFNSGMPSVSLYNSTFVVRRTDDGRFGRYQGIGAKSVNFLSGAPSSYKARNWIDGVVATDKASAYAALIADSKDYVMLDGQSIDSQTWTEHFSVNIADGYLILSYSPDVTLNSIDGVTAAATSSFATLEAEIGLAESGAKVYFAYAEGAVAPGTAEILRGSDLGSAISGTKVSTSVSGLTKYATYSYVFGIVVGNSVVARKSGTFVAKDYDAIFNGTTWIFGTVNDLGNSAKSVYVTGAPSYFGEIATPNKIFEEASVQAITLINGHSPILLLNSALIVSRGDSYLHEAPYALYPSHETRFVDFRHDEPAAGVVHSASSYTFKYADGDWAKPEDSAIFGYLFGDGRFIIDGEAVSVSDAAGRLSVIDNNPDSDAGTVTVTTVDEMPTSGDWTARPRARVRLTRNTRIGELAIPDSTGVVIDLNGFRLSVSSLLIEGERRRGQFTSTTLNVLSGSGSLVVGTGLKIVVR